MLSIDNAAVLAVMVKDLPGSDSKKALRWGLWSAYIFRGLCLWLAEWIVGIWWLKGLGGLYLLRLAYGHFTPEKDTLEEGFEDEKWYNIMYSKVKGKVGPLWSTIIMVEIMDLAFSIDNIFAAVALSKQMWVVCIGVFIGIAAMRFVAGWFLSLLKKYPSLEDSAFIVIALLGIKLLISSIADWSWARTTVPALNGVREVLEKHSTDLIFSGMLMLIFFLPLLIGSRKNPPGTNNLTVPV